MTEHEGIYTFMDCHCRKEIEIHYVGGDFIGKRMEGFCYHPKAKPPRCRCESPCPRGYAI